MRSSSDQKHLLGMTEMAEFVIKIADERGHTHQQVEQGYSVAEVRDRFAAQGYLVLLGKAAGTAHGGLWAWRAQA